MVAPKPIVQVHPTTHAVIRVWQAGSTAARRLGIDLSAISGTARGVRASGAGFRWRYPSGAEARSAVADAEPAAEELAIVCPWALHSFIHERPTNYHGVWSQNLQERYGKAGFSTERF